MWCSREKSRYNWPFLLTLENQRQKDTLRNGQRDAPAQRVRTAFLTPLWQLQFKSVNLDYLMYIFFQSKQRWWEEKWWEGRRQEERSASNSEMPLKCTFNRSHVNQIHLLFSCVEISTDLKLQRLHSEIKISLKIDRTVRSSVKRRRYWMGAGFISRDGFP